MDQQRPDTLWGCGDLDAVFGPDALTTPCPWPRARRGRGALFSTHSCTNETLLGLAVLDEVDPRTVQATQPSVLRHHAAYYLTGRWEMTGITSADNGQPTNRFPLVADDLRGGLVLLSGHHRALAALVRGTPLLCRRLPLAEVDGQPIALLPHLLFGTTARISHVVCDDLDSALRTVRSGRVALVAERTTAIRACLELAPSTDRRRLPIEPADAIHPWGVRAIGWSWQNAEVDVSGRFTMCTTCGQLRADSCPVTGYDIPERCACAPRPQRRTAEEAETHMACALCQLCGLQITKGHHRWRFVVCEPCRSVAGALNSRVGRQVAPPGIHTLVNGVARNDTADASTRQRLARFAHEFADMSAAISTFATWSRQMIIERLRALGYPEGLEIPLEDYLSACARAGIGPDDGPRRFEAALQER
ncbi:MAG: hypothetical protein ACKOA2_07230 [Ilumatobacteraceae bacterium]